MKCLMSNVSYFIIKILNKITLKIVHINSLTVVLINKIWPICKLFIFLPVMKSNYHHITNEVTLKVYFFFI
jgi:hypothetical protein